MNDVAGQGSSELNNELASAQGLPPQTAETGSDQVECIVIRQAHPAKSKPVPGRIVSVWGHRGCISMKTSCCSAMSALLSLFPLIPRHLGYGEKRGILSIGARLQWDEAGDEKTR